MSALHGIDHLVDLSLLKIDSEKLRMHQLIKDLGRYIVHMESPIDPGERSRLWRSQECFNVLREKTGTRRVKALALDMQTYQEQFHGESIIWGANPKKRKIKEQCGWTNTSNLNEIGLDTDAFSSMQSLKFLKLNNVELNGCYTYFPKGLRWLSWHRYHFKCIPNDLSLWSLVCLEMQYSNLKQLWKGSKFLPALKILNLSHSLSLASSPDLSGAPNLERLILDGCSQLVKVRKSIKYAEGLVLLNLKDCKRLRKLPRNISLLQSLEELVISGCSSLVGFPMGFKNLGSLKQFDANGIDMSALVCAGKGIPSWAFFPQFIEELSLKNCRLTNDCFPEDFSNLSLLKRLYLGGNMITSAPDCIRTLSNLVYLDVNNCPLLQYVVGLPITLKCHLSEASMEPDKMFFHHWESEQYISCDKCPKLAEIEGCYKRVFMRDVDRGVKKQLGLMLDLFNDVEVNCKCGILTTLVPLDKLPGCFNSFENTRDIIYFTVPDNRNNIQGLTLGFVYHKRRGGSYNLDMTVINKTKNKELNYSFIEWSNVCTKDEGVVWLWYIKLGTSLLQPGDQLSFLIDSSDRSYPKLYSPEVREFGVMVVYKEEDDLAFDGNKKLTTRQHNINPYPFTRQYCYFSRNSMFVSRTYESIRMAW